MRNAFMNTIMSVIEKDYPATGEVIAETQHSKSAMLDKALWHTLEIYEEVKAKYV